MKTANAAAVRRTAGIVVSSLAGGMALAAVVAAPSAFAAPDCSPQGVSNTSEAVTAQAQQYLADHPDANKVLMTAALQPRSQAVATVQSYTSTHPQESSEFKAIISPLGTLQKQCGVQVIPAQFQWAFDQFIG
jgi:hemophore-related protein